MVAVDDVVSHICYRYIQNGAIIQRMSWQSNTNMKQYKR